MFENDLKVRVMRRPYVDAGMELYVLDRMASTGETRSGEVVMRPRPGGTWVPPALPLNETMAQVLMDDLWSCGIRPSEGTGSAGAMAAQGRHLEDMRRIAYAGLKIKI